MKSRMQRHLGLFAVKIFSEIETIHVFFRERQMFLTLKIRFLQLKKEENAFYTIKTKTTTYGLPFLVISAIITLC